MYEWLEERKQRAKAEKQNAKKPYYARPMSQRFMSYTGAGGDGQVQPNMPVSIDGNGSVTHEGELEINGPAGTRVMNVDESQVMMQNPVIQKQLGMKAMERLAGLRGYQSGGFKPNQGTIDARNKASGVPMEADRDPGPPTVGGFKPNQGTIDARNKASGGPMEADRDPGPTGPGPSGDWTYTPINVKPQQVTNMPQPVTTSGNMPASQQVMNMPAPQQAGTIDAPPRPTVGLQFGDTKQTLGGEPETTVSTDLPERTYDTSGVAPIERETDPEKLAGRVYQAGERPEFSKREYDTELDIERPEGPGAGDLAWEEGMAGLKRIARGGSEALEAEGRQRIEEMQGQQAVDRLVAKQEAAQAGVGEEVGAGRMARLRASQEGQVGELEGELGVAKMKARQQAEEQLAEKGLAKQKFDEAMHQFDVGSDQWERAFKERLHNFDVGTEQWTETFQEGRKQFEHGSKQWWASFDEQAKEFDKNLEQWNKNFAETRYQFDVGSEQWKASMNAQLDQWKNNVRYRDRVYLDKLDRQQQLDEMDRKIIEKELEAMGVDIEAKRRSMNSKNYWDTSEQFASWSNTHIYTDDELSDMDTNKAARQPIIDQAAKWFEAQYGEKPDTTTDAFWNWAKGEYKAATDKRLTNPYDGMLWAVNSSSLPPEAKAQLLEPLNNPDVIRYLTGLNFEDGKVTVNADIPEEGRTPSTIRNRSRGVPGAEEAIHKIPDVVENVRTDQTPTGRTPPTAPAPLPGKTEGRSTPGRTGPAPTDRSGTGGAMPNPMAPGLKKEPVKEEPEVKTALVGPKRKKIKYSGKQMEEDEDQPPDEWFKKHGM